MLTHTGGSVGCHTCCSVFSEKMALIEIQSVQTSSDLTKYVIELVFSVKGRKFTRVQEHVATFFLSSENMPWESDYLAGMISVINGNAFTYLW